VREKVQPAAISSPMAFASVGEIPDLPTRKHVSGAASRSEVCAATLARSSRASMSACESGPSPSRSANVVSHSCASMGRSVDRVGSSGSLSQYQRQRIIDRLGSVVTVSADDERSQLRNRRLALDRLRQKLAGALRVETPRRPTRPGRGAVERRLDAKRRQAARKRDRRGGFDD